MQTETLVNPSAQADTAANAGRETETAPKQQKAFAQRVRHGKFDTRDPLQVTEATIKEPGDIAPAAIDTMVKASIIERDRKRTSWHDWEEGLKTAYWGEEGRKREDASDFEIRIFKKFGIDIDRDFTPDQARTHYEKYFRDRDEKGKGLKSGIPQFKQDVLDLQTELAEELRDPANAEQCAQIIERVAFMFGEDVGKALGAAFRRNGEDNKDQYINDANSVIDQLEGTPEGDTLTKIKRDADAYNGLPDRIPARRANPTPANPDDDHDNNNDQNHTTNQPTHNQGNGGPHPARANPAGGGTAQHTADTEPPGGPVESLGEARNLQQLFERMGREMESATGRTYEAVLPISNFAEILRAPESQPLLEQAGIRITNAEVQRENNQPKLTVTTVQTRGTPPATYTFILKPTKNGGLEDKLLGPNGQPVTETEKTHIYGKIADFISALRGHAEWQDDHQVFDGDTIKFVYKKNPPQAGGADQHPQGAQNPQENNAQNNNADQQQQGQGGQGENQDNRTTPAAQEAGAGQTETRNTAGTGNSQETDDDGVNRQEQENQTGQVTEEQRTEIDSLLRDANNRERLLTQEYDQLLERVIRYPMDPRNNNSPLTPQIPLFLELQNGRRIQIEALPINRIPGVGDTKVISVQSADEAPIGWNSRWGIRRIVTGEGDTLMPDGSVVHTRNGTVLFDRDQFILDRNLFNLQT